MNKIFKYMQCLTAGVLLTAAVTSCVYDSDTDTSAPQKGDGLILNLRMGHVGQTTRTATDITGDAGNTTVTNDEQEIQNVTFGVFSGTSTTLVGDIKQIEPADPTDATTQEYIQVFQAGDTPYAENDSILVAINMPTTPYATLAAAGDKDDFDQAELSIDDALTYGTGTDMDATMLPMMGKARLTASTTTNGLYEATVNMYHLVAKVTLASLSVEFDDDAHETHAAFTPTQIFLYSVPDNMDLRVNADGTYQYMATVADYYQGESTNATNYKDYLGTSALSGTTLDETDTYSTAYTFYTMPNKAGRSSLTDANRTRLIIKGKYTEDVDRDPTGHDAYYAINLGSTTDYSVEANYHYIVTAVIKGDGAATVNGTIPDIEHLTTTVTVGDWTEEATSVSVDNSGYHYSRTAVDYTGIQVGDIIYADGEWSRGHVYNADEQAAHGDPIAIVFSTTTTAYDSDVAQNGIGNFTHGYAMALKNAIYSGSSVILSDGWCASIANAEGTTNLRELQVTDAFFTSESTVKADMDGLKHCLTAKGKAEASANYSLADLYAINTAMVLFEAQQHAPKNTVWFLPSIGQQYQWMVQLANMPTTGYTADTSHTPAWYWYLADPAATTYANNMNTRLGTTAGIPAAYYDTFKGKTGEYFWSSTERAAGYPFSLNFRTNGYLNLHGYDDKSHASLQVRAVLAF